MRHTAFWLSLPLLASVSTAAETPEVTLSRFLQAIRTDLNRIPDFTCTQTIQRFNRGPSEPTWHRVDTLRLEVGYVRGREMYARAGGRAFEERPLIDIVGRGAISTGQFAAFARDVFVTSSTSFSYRREVEREGAVYLEYDFDVPVERSGYRLRSGTSECPVAFQGTFWVNPKSLELVRLEIVPYDIPEKLGLAEAPTTLEYSRVTAGTERVLLPVSATFSTVARDGVETMNRTALTSCRRFAAESAIAFERKSDTGEADRMTPPHPPATAALPPRTVLELSLAGPLNPAAASVGDLVRAVLTRAIKDGDRILVPEGSTVLGRIARVDKSSSPFLVYEVGLEFDRIEAGGSTVSLAATMEDAGPAAGLIRQSKKLDPTFTRQRKARLEILVKEVQRGQGILTWDGRRGGIPQGLRMRWRVDPEPSSAR